MVPMCGAMRVALRDDLEHKAQAVAFVRDNPEHKVVAYGLDDLERKVVEFAEDNNMGLEADMEQDNYKFDMGLEAVEADMGEEHIG